MSNSAAKNNVYAITALFAVLIFAVYGPSLFNDFVNYDDPLYVTGNAAQPRISATTGTRFEIFDAAERLGKRLKLIKTISDGGRDVFEIYVPERKS